MAELEFYIDIEDASGNKLGGGPIVSASGWRYTARMDKAGSFSFTMPASDAKSAYVQKKRTARAWARLGSTWTEVGAGIIDVIQRRPNKDGTVTLAVSGDSEERELTYRGVGFLNLSGSGSGVTHSSALSSIGAFAPAGWTFNAASSPGNNYYYAAFAGENVLAALIMLAEKTQTHFYRSGPRALTFFTSFTSSGIRAIQATAALASETCAIVDLTEEINTYDLASRIYPYGAGNGAARLTLAATTRSAPSGFVLDKVTNHIRHTATENTYGRIEEYVEFKDVAPVSNTSADVRAAADMLFDAALELLKQRSTELEAATYTVKLAECSALLRPGQTLHIAYRDSEQNVDIDQDLNILEATIEVNTAGLRTTGLVVSTSDRWLDNDATVVVDRLKEGKIYQRHPQLNANSYVISYSKNTDWELAYDEDEGGWYGVSAHPAQFYFRFGSEVTQLTQVAFDFQVLPFTSTVAAVTSESATSSAGGGTTATSTSGGGSTVSSSSGGGTTESTTSGGGTTATSTSGGGSTVSSSSGGGTTETTYSGNAFHGHNLGIGNGFSGTTVFYLNNAFYTNGGGSVGINAVNATHTHDVDLPSHTHSVTINNHSHDVTIPSHSHSVTIPNHTHSVTVAGHTHNVTIPNHTHDVTPNVSMRYGIFNDDSDNVPTLDYLEWRINGGAWSGPSLLSDVTSLGNGWYRLDLTSYLIEPDTLRPAQENNLLEIRLLYFSEYELRCTIDAQLTIRNIIQATAYI